METNVGNEHGQVLMTVLTMSVKFAGKMVAFSIFNGGPGLPVLHPLVFQLMFGQHFDMDVLECIIDPDAKVHLSKVLSHLPLIHILLCMV